MHQRLPILFQYFFFKEETAFKATDFNKSTQILKVSSPSNPHADPQGPVQFQPTRLHQCCLSQDSNLEHGANFDRNDIMLKTQKFDK